MSEDEDGSAVENPMVDRFDPPDGPGGDTSSTEADTPDQEDDAGDTDNSDTTDSTDNTDNSDQAAESDSSSGETRRDRPHTAIYVSEDLVERVEDRFTKMKGELMLEGKQGLEKHRHFYEGLLEAGLENDDLDDIVMEKFEE